MIVARNETAPDYLGIHPNLDEALRRITPEFLSSLGADRVDIIPGQVWCTKFTYDTIPDSESFFEAHENFLDIHLMLAGSERVEIASPGSFLVVWPDDAHKIKMMLSRPETVTKAVFKVKIHE